MTRYEIRPIANENCDSLNDGECLGTAWTYEGAKALIEEHRWARQYGVGIIDTVTDQIDVGFGLGVPCPDFSAQ